MPKSPQMKLLEHLQTSWPAALRLRASGDDAVEVPPTHPLAGEVNALLRGATASLPAISANSIRWNTFAADPAALPAAVEQLRAWIIPSFAWEVEQDAYLVDRAGEALADIAAAAGFRAIYRWQSGDRELARISAKLAAARHLDERPPPAPFVRAPSLMDLRRQYASALAVGDQKSADAAVAAISEHQLESPANVAFLRYRLWDRFLEALRITQDVDLDRFVRQEMPQRARLAVARAFHAIYLAEFEARGDLAGSLAAYEQQIRPRLAGLIPLLRASEGVEAARLLAYEARARDSTVSADVRAVDDEWTKRLLSVDASAPASAEALSDEDQLLEAAGRRDWTEVQRVGLRMLHAEPASELVRTLLLRSLLAIPNGELENQLAPAAASATTSPTQTRQRAKPTVQSWAQWLAAIHANDPQQSAAADSFARSENRSSLNDLSAAELDVIVDQLDDLYTAEGDADALSRGRIVAGLAELISDLAHQPEFPRREWASLYLGLLRLWSVLNAGSLDPLDASVLLTLADASLTHKVAAEKEVAELLAQWWRTRRVWAQVPFALDAIELLTERTTAQGTAEALWLDAGDFLRRDLERVAPTDRALWRRVGRGIGFDDQTIDAYLPPLPAVAKRESEDPISAAQLTRIAIVWRRQDLANNAVRRIAKRTNAEVFVVYEEHPRGQTTHALGADVILFVWGNVSHAVFHELENVPRARFAYVPVPTVANVERTLERWAISQLKSTQAS